VPALALPPGGGRPIGPGRTVKVEYGRSSHFAVLESELPPGWDGVPPHLHQHYDEAFSVLDGTVTFTLDGRAAPYPRGSFVFVPRGVAHGFANPSDTPARLLVVGSPGAVRLVEDIHRLSAAGPPDPEALAALYRAHHSEIVAPTGP
jgi:quercetin dioxygenase-like cupin family protein